MGIFPFQKEEKKGDSESEVESESNIDDFDVDNAVMSNVNAVIENGVLEVRLPGRYCFF